MSGRWKPFALGVLTAAAVGGGFVLAGQWRTATPTLPDSPAGALKLRAQDFALDPAWEGRNNRRLGQCVTTRQDFGLRGAEGQASLGGLVTRAARPAWYGKQVALDFERPFRAEGVMTVRGTHAEPFPSGSAIVGFFNGANRDWRPPNLLGFQIIADTVEDRDDYWLSLSYASRDFKTAHVPYGGEDDPVGFRFGQAYRWQLSYDPAGADGRGAVTLSIPDAGPPVTLELAPEARAAGATLDRFGLGNQAMARGEGMEMELGALTLDGRPVEPGAGWRGEGNSASYRDCLTGQPNSFGWSGPRDQRLGGVVGRTDEQNPELRAYYGDPVAPLSLDDRLHMEGTVQLDRANSDSATLLGWFAAGATGEGEAEEAPANFLGVTITGPSAVGQYLSPLIANSNGSAERPEEEAGIVLNPGPGVHRFSLDYYPDSGRGGTMELRLDDRRVSWTVPTKIARAGASFDRFGIRNLENGGSFQVVYFDNLRYTAASTSGRPAQVPLSGSDPKDESGRSRNREESVRSEDEEESDGREGGRERRGKDRDGDDKRRKRDRDSD